MQHSPAHTEAAAVPEVRGRAARTGDIGDAGDLAPIGLDTKLPQVRDPGGHDALAAGLIDRTVSRLDDNDIEAGASGFEGGDETDWSAADDDEVSVRVGGSSGGSSCVRVGGDVSGQERGPRP